MLFFLTGRFPFSVSPRVCVCTRVCAAEPLRRQGWSIMINRQTRQLSHTITLHYSSQDLKVKMNGSSSTPRLHTSLFFPLLFFPRFSFPVESLLLSGGSLSFYSGIINWQMVDLATPSSSSHLQGKWQVLNLIIVKFVAPAEWNEP